MNESTTTGVEMLDEAWTLSPSVALRHEPFGALAYHFGNRRLTFLKRLALVRVVEALAEASDVREALVLSGVREGEYGAYCAALRGLADSAMIQRKDAA